MSFRIARFVLVPLFMLPIFNAIDAMWLFNEKFERAQSEFNRIRARQKG